MEVLDSLEMGAPDKSKPYLADRLILLLGKVLFDGRYLTFTMFKFDRELLFLQDTALFSTFVQFLE